MFEIQKEAIIHAGKMLDRYQLIALSGGNLSWRMEDGSILMTPSGMIYEDLVHEDIVVMDGDGKIIEGQRRPSVDGIAIRRIFKDLPHINAVIHTHQPCATALGLVMDEIPCSLTTMANAAKGAVKVAPYSSAASIDMGIETVKHLNGKNAVVLKHHGVITVGKSLKEALYAAVYLEEACRTLILAMSTGKELETLNSEAIEQAVKVFDNYGQSVN